MLRLRGAVAALVATGVCLWLMVTVGACGSLSEGNAATGFGNDAGAEPPDSGSASDVTVGDAPGADSGFPDGGVSPESGGADSGMVVTGGMLVHASPDLPDVRLCWKVGDGGYSSTDVPFPATPNAPASNYPALPVGGSVALSDEQAGTMVGNNLVITAIPASPLETVEKGVMPPRSCSVLLDPNNTGGSIIHVINTYDFDVPDGIAPGATNLIALAGASGNLHVDDVQLTEVDSHPPGVLPVQAALLSPILAQQLGDAGVATVSFGAPDAMAPLTTLSGEGAIAPSTPSPLAVGDAGATYGEMGFTVDAPGPSGADGGAVHLFLTLEQSLELAQGPMVDPVAYYTQQTGYVVAIIGDPNGALPFTSGSTYDGTGLHILVLPQP
jgi:hypothetical protein